MKITKILIKNLDATVGTADLLRMLSDFGIKTQQAEVIFDKLTGKSTGQGIFEIASDEAHAILLSGIYVAHGKQLEMKILQTI